MRSARDGTVGVAHYTIHDEVTLQTAIRRVNTSKTRTLRKGMILYRYNDFLRNSPHHYVLHRCISCELWGVELTLSHGHNRRPGESVMRDGDMIRYPAETRDRVVHV